MTLDKKQSTKETVENRLAGLERRFSNFEEELRDNRFETARLGNKIVNQGNNLARLEDKLIFAYEKSFEEFRSKMVSLIDPLFGQLKKFNEEQNIHEGQHKEEYDDIQSLKKIHPNNKHVFPSTASA